MFRIKLALFFFQQLKYKRHIRKSVAVSSSCTLNQQYVLRFDFVSNSNLTQLTWIIIDLSIGSTETKYIKLNTKTQFLKTTFDFCIHFKKENIFFSFCFLVPLVKVYKKVAKFSFTQQKMFQILVFSFMYLVSVDPMDRSIMCIFFSEQIVSVV